MNKYIYLLIASCAITGCEDRSAPAAPTPAAPSVVAPAPTAVAVTPAPPPPVVKKEPDINDEALTYAKEFMQSHLAKCGDALILNTVTKEWVNGQSMGDSFRFFQLADPTIELGPARTISDADKLNGLEWFGKIRIHAKAYRIADLPDHLSFGATQSTWSEWKDPETTNPYVQINNLILLGKASGNYAADANVVPNGMGVYLTKRDKKWQMNAGYDVVEGASLSLNIADPVDCDSLPK